MVYSSFVAPCLSDRASAQRRQRKRVFKKTNNNNSKLFVYLQLHRVLVATHGIFILFVACGIFSCNMWTLGYSLWDLVP